MLSHLFLLLLTCIMSESVGSGDGYLSLEDSSFEEDSQFIIIWVWHYNNNESGTKKRRRGGGSKKGKSKNKNRNRRLGHTFLIKVRCCLLLLLADCYFFTFFSLFCIILFIIYVRTTFPVPIVLTMIKIFAEDSGWDAIYSRTFVGRWKPVTRTLGKRLIAVESLEQAAIRRWRRRFEC